MAMTMAMELADDCLPPCMPRYAGRHPWRETVRKVHTWGMCLLTTSKAHTPPSPHFCHVLSSCPLSSFISHLQNNSSSNSNGSVLWSTHGSSEKRDNHKQ